MAGEFRADLTRMLSGVGSSPWARVRFLLLSSEMHCVACYRLGQFCNRLTRRRNPLAIPVGVVQRIWNRWCTHVHHCEISRKAEIGPGFLIMHRHGVTIGPIVAGRNLTVYQNVTIGLRVARGDHGLPQLGDDVWLGPGATLSGAVHLADGVTVSAGTVLSRDVPARCLVAGNPGRVITQDYDNSAMINSPLSET